MGVLWLNCFLSAMKVCKLLLYVPNNEMNVCIHNLIAYVLDQVEYGYSSDTLIVEVA